MDLGPAENWQYLSEGKNHVVLSQVQPSADLFNGANLVLRLRKCQNQKYYRDPLLMPELDYNQLFMRNMLLNNANLSKFVNGNQTIVRVSR